MMTIDGGPKAAAAAAAHISPLFPLSRVSSIRAAPAICAPMASNVLARSQCGPGLVDKGRLAARTRPRMMISLARVSFFFLSFFLLTPLSINRPRNKKKNQLLSSSPTASSTPSSTSS